VKFQGWSRDALTFYEGLEADNSKSYWTSHKAVYDNEVLAPMAALIDELAPQFGDGRIFRPNRDIRFSADKSPYKTGIGAMVGDGYVQLSSKGLAAGSGMHMMAPDQLDRYRQAVAGSSGEELVQIIRSLARKQIEVGGNDRLKSAPRGYPKDHPRIDLLRNKSLTAWKEWPPAAWLATSAAKSRVVDFLRASQPLTSWLTTQVGPTTMDTSRR
jgi:uncharacterized protein (TIGR02453 family)